MSEATFDVGDAVWIDDGYSGAPHAATVTGVSENTLWVESIRRVPNDSRVIEWGIRSELVAEMVRSR